MFRQSAMISNTGVIGNGTVFFRIGFLTIYCRGNYGDIENGKVYVDGREITPFDDRITKFALQDAEGTLTEVSSYEKQIVFEKNVKGIEKVYDNQGFYKGSDLSSPALISRSIQRNVGDEKKAFAEQDKLKNYSETVTKYIASLNSKPKNSETIKELKLIEQELKLFDSWVDRFHETIPDIPVRLNSRIYNLDTLLQLPENAGIRLDPISQTEFYLRDIQDARDVQNAIQETIQSIKSERAKEKPLAVVTSATLLDLHRNKGL